MENFTQRSIYRPGYPFRKYGLITHYLKDFGESSSDVFLKLRFDHQGRFQVFVEDINTRFFLEYSESEAKLQIEEILDDPLTGNYGYDCLISGHFLEHHLEEKNLVFQDVRWDTGCHDHDIKAYNFLTHREAFRIRLQSQRVYSDFEYLDIHPSDEKVLISFDNKSFEVYSIHDGKYLFSIQIVENASYSLSMICINEKSQQIYFFNQINHSLNVYSWIDGHYLFSFNVSCGNPRIFSYSYSYVHTMAIDREGRILLGGIRKFIVSDPLGNVLYCCDSSDNIREIVTNPFDDDIAIRTENDIFLISGDFWSKLFNWDISLFPYYPIECQQKIFTLTMIRTYCWESSFSLLPNELLFLIFEELWEHPTTIFS